IAGVECECALGRVMNPTHYESGWHSTATLGRLGAAAACARLLTLTPEQTSRSLGFAGAQAAGLKSSFGTMAKPFQVGKAAGDGLLSALLAANGASAPESILEGPFGLVMRYAGPRADHSYLSLDGVSLRAVMFKFHAACHLLHPMLDAI